jgi:hypothetical protein
MAWRRGQAYGQDLRDRVLAFSDLTLVQVATRFGVSPSYVSKVRAGCVTLAMLPKPPAQSRPIAAGTVGRRLARADRCPARCQTARVAVLPTTTWAL